MVQNPSIEQLIHDCVELDDCRLTRNGAVVAYSGKYTGRLPEDKFIVADASSESLIWWGNNHRMEPQVFEHVRFRMHSYTLGKKLYVIDTFAGADPAHRIAARFIVERPYHALFIKQLLIRPTAEQLASYEPDWTIVDMGKANMSPAEDHTRTAAVIALNMIENLVLIAGTQYAGEMKKSVFTIMNFLLPQEGVLSMHCSANIGPEDDTALFFGLSGTGKTTLSADHDRSLIGDDEHGWSDQGVFNIEGGCYAKCIRLSEKNEPEIWSAIRHGAILENVVLMENGTPDYNSVALTENTRVAYPLDHIEHAVQPSMGGHPKHIIFLTCDALGVLPPISRLTPEQAMYQFLNGYTAKVAGTESGVTEPTVVFSSCFGQPFLPLPPKVYAGLLGDRIRNHGSQVWLVNTGWTGGGCGVGKRIDLPHTRAMIRAALGGQLDDVAYTSDPIFGMDVPNECPGVPSQLLHARDTWADKDAYDVQARKLQAQFDENHRLYV